MFMMGPQMSGGTGSEPLYAQINRDLKTKRIGGKQLHNDVEKYSHHDIDPNHQNYEELTDSSKISSMQLGNSENRTDSAKLHSAAANTVDIYKNLNNNNATNNNQNQWV